MPKVSVLLTNYNCDEYIARAISSILAQSFGDFELLISDDASTDTSVEAIDKYVRLDPRITLFQQSTNLGLVGNYNFLFSKARGELVAIQDADDWSGPERLARQMSVLDDPAYVLCSTGGIFHYPDGTARELDCKESHTIDGISGNPVAIPASIMFRRNMLDLYPGWPTYFAGGTSMDRYWLMDLLDGRTGYHLAEPLYNVRFRAGSNCRVWNQRKLTSHQLFRELERQRITTGSDWLRDERVAEMMAFEVSVGATPSLVAQSMREGAVINVDCSNFGASFSLVTKSLLLSPTSILTWRTAAYLARKYIGSIYKKKN